MAKHKNLVFKRFLIGSLLEFLNVPVAGQAARARNRFILRFNDEVKDTEDRRQKLLKEFGELDSNKNLIAGVDGQYKLKDADGFNKAYAAMMQEDVKITITNEEILDVQAAYAILSDLDMKLTVAQTSQYDEIMNVLETYAGADVAA